MISVGTWRTSLQRTCEVDTPCPTDHRIADDTRLRMNLNTIHILPAFPFWTEIIHTKLTDLFCIFSIMQWSTHYVVGHTYGKTKIWMIKYMCTALVKFIKVYNATGRSFFHSAH